METFILRLVFLQGALNSDRTLKPRTSTNVRFRTTVCKCIINSDLMLFLSLPPARTEISPFLSFSPFFPNNGSHWQKLFFRCFLELPWCMHGEFFDNFFDESFWWISLTIFFSTTFFWQIFHLTKFFDKFFNL